MAAQLIVKVLHNQRRIENNSRVLDSLSQRLSAALRRPEQLGRQFIQVLDPFIKSCATIEKHLRTGIEPEIGQNQRQPPLNTQLDLETTRSAGGVEEVLADSWDLGQDLMSTVPGQRLEVIQMKVLASLSELERDIPLECTELSSRLERLRGTFLDLRRHLWERLEELEIARKEIELSMSRLVLEMEKIQSKRKAREEQVVTASLELVLGWDLERKKARWNVKDVNQTGMTISSTGGDHWNGELR